MNDPITTTTEYYNTHAHTGWIDRKTNSFYCEEQFTQLAQHWPTSGTVLDIGCAAGIHVPLFLGIGRHTHYHGLDSSTSFIEVARRRYPQLPFTLGSITDTSLFTRNQFVGFWANSVLMHIPFSQWDTVFAYLEEIIVPGGYGYLSLPTAHPEPNPTDTRHFTLLTAAEQVAYLTNRQWRIVEQGTFDGFTRPGIWHWYTVQLPQK
jgi:trans-aconitate methyltransferase